MVVCKYMKKSRVGLFKSSSMLIAILGIIMIIAAGVVLAYVGFSVVSDSLSGGVSSGVQYDQLNELKANYSSLEAKFDAIQSQYYAQDNPELQQKYVDAEVYLVHAKNCLDAVDSALASGEDSSEVDGRLKEAKLALDDAQRAYNNLVA